MKILIAMLALLFPLAPLRAEDEPKSENDAKTVRSSDGKFIKVPAKKDAPTRKADDKPSAKKPDEKPADADKAIDAAEVDKLTKLDGKEVTVRGKVHEVFVPASGSVAVLNMGKDFKSCFKVAIYKANFGKFGGLDEIKKFKDKSITVEGKVSIYQKLPQIAASVPSQLKAGE